MKDNPLNSSSDLVFVALGGLGEIGMNVYLYGFGRSDKRQWLMVDLGITFPNEDEPGIDIILPDLRFIEDESQNLAGIVITHAHEDHIGAVAEMWPILKAPVYTTPFAAYMLRAKLAEFPCDIYPIIKEVPVRSSFTVGPFALELISMAHSIPETSGLVIKTPLGTVFHTADWKIDPVPYLGEVTDEARIVELGQDGIDILICDSTNSFREGTSPSETEVAKSLTNIIAQQSGRIAITTFSSNVSRIKAIADAAQEAGRQLVVVGRALHRAIRVAIDSGHLPVDFNYLDQEYYSHLAPNEALAIVTGSQGEPRAAMARIASSTHRDIKLTRGDTVIYSSRTIPGNEKAVLAIQNSLAALGCNVITDDNYLVHATGHSQRNELINLYSWVQPKIMIPMHGEIRHLHENARLARLAGIPIVIALANGQMVRLAPNEPKIIGNVPVGRYYRDGRLIMAADSSPVRQRRKLSVVGFVAVALAITSRGDVLGGVDLVIDGVPLEDSHGKLIENLIFDAINGTIDSIPKRRRKDCEMIRDALRRAVRAKVERVWGKRPIVKILINIVDAA
ncbi:MAG: ribonuclease J [Hyphomicrobiaceae bacterium]|nr:ribonuclease J [Hyphomicrobiaceae bacterium]